MTKSIAQDTMDGWYFAHENKKLQYGDNRAIVVGKTHRVRGDLELCYHGLHASTRAIDALAYAPGPIVYRVRLHGTILRGDDKACATARTYVAGGVDATETLRAFGRWCALEVAHLWDMPPIARQYLETGDESIVAAAWAAARAAARDAAWDAAMAAARAAARDAAWAAARDAAMAAARAAARDAARDAARAAAWAAAMDAAMDAFIDRANAELERRLIEFIG